MFSKTSARCTAILGVQIVATGVPPFEPPITQKATAELSAVAGAGKDGQVARDMPNGVEAPAPMPCVVELNVQLDVEPEMVERAVSRVGFETTSQETMERKHTVWALTVPSSFRL